MILDEPCGGAPEAGAGDVLMWGHAGDGQERAQKVVSAQVGFPGETFEGEGLVIGTLLDQPRDARDARLSSGTQRARVLTAVAGELQCLRPHLHRQFLPRRLGSAEQSSACPGRQRRPGGYRGETGNPERPAARTTANARRDVLHELTRVVKGNAAIAGAMVVTALKRLIRIAEHH